MLWDSLGDLWLDPLMGDVMDPSRLFRIVQHSLGFF